MPTQGPKTAEKRPASPPATMSRMSSGESHLGTSSASDASATRAVNSPWRSSQAGRRTASQMAARTSSLLQPPAASVSACSGQMTNSVAAPTGHQFGLQSVAAAHPSAAASSSGVRLRCSEIESGASPASSVTADAPGGSPRSTWSGGHGLRSSSSARQVPTLPGWPSVERSSRPGMPSPVRATTSRSARPMVAFARVPGPSAPMPEFSPAAAAPARSRPRSGRPAGSSPPGRAG